MKRPSLRSGRGLALVGAAALLATLLPAAYSTALAKPLAKPGRVTGLVLSATKPGSSYDVSAGWNAATRATKYQVTLADAAGTLDRETVTTTSFTAPAVAAVSARVTLSVTPFNGTRRGRATSQSLVLPDLTAPTATYTLTPQDSPDGNVTVNVSALSDDLSQAANITQTVDWGDSTPTSSGNGLVTSFAHAYGPTQAVYHPVVTVTDQAGNSRAYTLTSVVADTTPPTGTFTVSPPKAWAKWTRVTVTQTALDDNVSDQANISRVVLWADGTTQPWTTGTTLTHVYKAGGTFAPVVTITDQAGNAAQISTAAVAVRVDSVAPWTRSTPPKHAVRSVRSWTTLRGRARDAGTGVRVVRVRAIEKRGSVWYSYRPLRRVWVRGGRTRDIAWKRSR
ncbi:MAG: hypothetical protein ACRDPG_13165, partial [Nocardioidaceae bacterium]